MRKIMSEKVVCIFIHSQDEFGSIKKLQDWLTNSLKTNGEYKLQKFHYRNAESNFIERLMEGSLVLFRKKGYIVGRAITNTKIINIDPPEQGQTENTGKWVSYYYKVYVVPNSVALDMLSISEIEKWAKREKPFSTRRYYIVGTRQEFEQQFGSV
jgi:hypothetical protein